MSCPTTTDEATPVHPSFDLTSQSWLPVRLADGSVGTPLGLRELLCRAHTLSDATLPLPPASAQLWRVLALLTARVTGLDSAEGADEWYLRRRDVLDAGSLPQSEVDGYFSAHSDRFDLFHPERPWLQDPRLREQCSKTSGINKLTWGRTAGQNQVWLGGHHHDLAPVPLSPAEAAWHLLATLGHGPSGRCTTRTVGERSEANSTAGPLRTTLSFHPVGRTLFESLILNIPFPGEQEPDETDLAPWERADLPDPLGPPEEPTGLAGVLVNQAAHAVLLVPGEDGSEVVDAYVTWARRERPVAPTDPYLIHQTAKDGRRYARAADSSRAVWRDLDSLLLESPQDRYRPELLSHLTSRTRLPLQLRQAMRLAAFGFDQDGQTRDKQWFTATTPPVLRWLEDSAAEDPEDGARARTRIRLSREAAERSGRRLHEALTAAWKESNSPSGGVKTDTGTGPWLRKGTARYWSTAERVFWDIAVDEDADGPGNSFIRLALDAYDEVTSPYCHRSRVAKVVEQHRSRLFDGWVNERTDEGDAA
ncbi:type I-E CRISPR-associated protein Cse1/CasA [Nocardiopsis algeriensis]|uniref:type I-E CRISPR-associated protein Cse1/CasA n=1 Tax=Nocardiopsis algeriensis TaxID=1478215 RepID=UPI003B42A464